MVLLKVIDNHFAVAIIRIIYIYLHFITVYVSLYLFTLPFLNCSGKPEDRLPKGIRLIQFNPIKLTG